MANIRPCRAEVPEGFEAHGPNFYMVPLLAHDAQRRYRERRLTPIQWGSLLRMMRFAPERIATLKAALSDQYPNPLGFDEWCNLFEQLAIERTVATQNPCPR